MDLINRKELIDLLLAEGMITAAIYVERMPSAEKTGKWIILEDSTKKRVFDECKCSECGCIKYFTKGYKHYNYCPNCGAKMVEE